MSGTNRTKAAAGKKVLLVDDDPEQLLIRALLLERQGFRCSRAADLSSALDSARNQLPDCVLMDLAIPAERDGVMLMQALQGLPNKPVIIILTGRRIARLRAQPRFQHVAAFIEKGSPAADLILAVTRACN